MENIPQNPVPPEQQTNQPANMAREAGENVVNYSRKNSTGVLLFIKKGIISLIGFIRFSIMQIISQIFGKE